MLTPLTMYILTRGDAFIALFNEFYNWGASLGTLGFIVMVIVSGCYLCADPHDLKGTEARKAIILGWSLTAFCLGFSTINGLLKALVPTKVEMAAIIVVPLVANNKEIQKIPTNVAELANEWIKTLRPKEVQK